MNKIIKIIIIALIAIFLILAFIGNYFFEISVGRKAFKSNVTNQEHSTVKKDHKKDYFESKNKEVKMISTTGVDLIGYEFVVDEKRPWIIVVHGYTSDARRMGNHIYNFNKRNYNVLAPDLIAHGKSKGEFISMGGYDSKDIRKWIDFLNKKYKNPNILLFGISMGASTVMNTLDENLPNNVKAFIEDSGYLTLTGEFSQQLKKLYHLPYFPIIPVASITTKIRAGYFFSEVDATNALKNTKLPALILHGTKDTFVPTENSKKIYNLLKSKKMIYLSEGAKHTEGYRMDSDNYWSNIDKFMNLYFN